MHVYTCSYNEIMFKEHQWGKMYIDFTHQTHSIKYSNDAPLN